MEVDFGDLEANLFFCSVLLGEVDFDDLETRLLTFLVTFFGVVDFVDFEVLIYFLQCAFLVKSISLTSRHDFCSPFWVTSFK